MASDARPNYVRGCFRSHECIGELSSTDGSLLGSWTIDSANADPRGITTDPLKPDNLWIVDNRTDSVYEYLGASIWTSGSQSASSAFAIDASNPQGIADPPMPASGHQAVPHANALNDWAPTDRIPSSAHGATTSKSLAGVQTAFGNLVRLIELRPGSLPVVVHDRSADERDRVFQSLAFQELLETEGEHPSRVAHIGKQILTPSIESSQSLFVVASTHPIN